MHYTYDKNKEIYPRHISVKLLKAKDKQRNLEDSKRKTTHHIQGNNNRINNWLLIRGQRAEEVGRKCQPRILQLAFKNEDKIKVFLDKQKQKICFKQT